ncbi:MAG: hypothetical protein OEW12_01460 [Deltaproteobacteria bacterium]|nr:hypothetical protein [Deltaproteobacteria bacterium]
MKYPWQAIKKSALALWVGLVLSFFAAPALGGEVLWLNMVAATSVENQSPFQIFTGGGWRAEKDAQFVKVHLYFDRDFDFSQMDVTTCSPLDQKKSIWAYLNFDGEFLFSDPDSDHSVSIKAKKPIPVHSVTLNFRSNSNLCIQSIQLKGRDGTPYDIRVPRFVSGGVNASTTLKPAKAYNVMNLFDSRYENAWSTDGQTTGGVLTFVFDQPQSVQKLKIWNGYQRSDVHCIENSRVKTLHLEGDNGYTADVPVLDVMGGQEIPLPKPFTGKKLTLTITDGFKGKTYKDLVITELRFFDGQGWFMPDPTPQILAVAADNRQSFRQAGMDDLLNQTLLREIRDAGDDEGELRLRPDGSFYLSNTIYGKYVEKEGGQRVAKQEGLGNYEVKSTKDGRLELRLFGILRTTIQKGVTFDCNGCGRDCNQAKKGLGKSEKIFQEFITLQKRVGGGDDSGPFEVGNTSGKHLKFKSYRASLYLK